MRNKVIIDQFAELLIKEKRKIRAVQYIILLSFIGLSIGIVLALPLRYYLGIGVITPLILFATLLVLSAIYGFLGIENKIDVLKLTDTKLDLNEKLSAAYQFADTENPYSSLLVNDAIDIIENTKVNDVFSIRFSKRDPFQPLLLALFFFLWMSSFSFLQISDDNMADGEMLLDIAGKIDAVNSDEQDKDVEELADEYRKLGNRIQDHYMNEKSIENEVQELSQKLERQVEELSREGIEKESQTLSDEEAENEVFQLQRKQEMSDELSDILESMMKSFSMPSNSAPEGMRRGDASESTDGDETILTEEEIRTSSQYEEIESEDIPDDGYIDDSATLDPGNSDEETGENKTAEATDPESPAPEDENQGENLENSNQNPLSKNMEQMEDSNSSTMPGNEKGEDEVDWSDYREEQQSGEFDEENIEGDLQEGEQMKSFIRALPHIVDPTLKDMEVIHFYRNQLETAIDKEILPEGYESVIRDYFLSIGVLNE